MMGWGYGMGTGMWISWLILVLIIALVVFLVVQASSPDRAPRQQGPPSRATGRPTPFDILADRYARGEISTAEYEERLSHLTS